VNKLEDCSVKVAGKCASIPPFRPGNGSFGTSFGSPWIQEGQSATIIQVRGECVAGGQATVWGGRVATATNPITAVGAGALNSSGTCPSANRANILVESDPDYVMGFTNTINYKDFSVYGLLDWRKGGKAVNLTNNYWDSSNLLRDTVVSQKRNADFAAAKSVYVEDAGFLKLRELNFAYRIPSKLTAQYFSFAKDVRMEVSGRNLWTKTKYTGYDPEVSNFSNQSIGRFQDVTPYPPSRSWFFSLSANF